MRCRAMTNHASHLCLACRSHDDETGFLNEFNSKCKCPCWGGAPYLHVYDSDVEVSDSETSEVAQVAVARRRRRPRKSKGGGFNPYGGEGPSGKRQRVPSDQRPAVPLVSSAYPELQAPQGWMNVYHPRGADEQGFVRRMQQRRMRSVFNVFKKLISRKNAAQVTQQKHFETIEILLTGVSFPLENPSDVVDLIQGLKNSGVPYTAMSRYWGISDRLISEFANGYIAGKRWANAASKVSEAVNRRWQEALLAAQENDESDDDSLQGI